MKNTCLCLIFLILQACSSRDVDTKRIGSSAISPELPSHLNELTSSLENGEDAQIPLIDGLKAFYARMYLVNEAKHSLDIQYYIWHNDQTGKQLLKSVLLAADRGVRVRLLLDSMNESKFKKSFAIMENHPKIEVKLVNPGIKHINHRMHNKALVADNQAVIVGGRNIGDEYFHVSEKMNFGDFDILLFGPAVQKISKEFDVYWNNDRSFPVSEIYKDQISKQDLEEADKRLKEIKIPAVANPFKDPVYRGKTHVVYDPPSKLSGSRRGNLMTSLRPYLKEAKKELLLVSPYFIPGKDGVKNLSDMERKGVRVIVITNSLASNDVTTVFGGYKKYREDLLENGIEIYEMKGKREKIGIDHHIGSSNVATGLHGKVMIIDNKTMYIGSMNLDPRSIDLNTEMGVVLKELKLANDVSWKLKESLPEISYKLKMTGDKIRWLERTEESYVTHKREPETTWWMRTKVWFSSIIIPESML